MEGQNKLKRKGVVDGYLFTTLALHASGEVWHARCNGSGDILTVENISTELQHPMLRSLIGAKLCPLATCGGLT